MENKCKNEQNIKQVSMYTSHDLTVSSCLQDPLLDKSNEFRLRCDFPCNFTLWKKVCDKNVNVNSTIFS